MLSQTVIGQLVLRGEDLFAVGEPQTLVLVVGQEDVQRFLLAWRKKKKQEVRSSNFI